MNAYDLDPGRFSQGMATERLHPWHARHLYQQPLETTGMVGAVAVIRLMGEDGGCTYESTDNRFGLHYRHAVDPEFVRHM
ncbi:MAG: hypothetical protein KGI98_17565 [Euryarchaeota archaeon]|nr:hypothetical protein [Euryarchaeota archaeon]